jgi:uncharacterized membrane protein YccC
MELKGIKLYLAIALTFVAVFLVNYLGNSGAEDQLSRALMVGFGGAVGLGISFWYMGRKTKDDDKYHDFD